MRSYPVFSSVVLCLSGTMSCLSWAFLWGGLIDMRVLLASTIYGSFHSSADVKNSNGAGFFAVLSNWSHNVIRHILNPVDGDQREAQGVESPKQPV